VTSSLGKGLFHVRTAPSDKPLTLVKYRLQPRFTPLPLRVRLFSKSEDSLLSIMVQYVANPYLPGVLKDVNFILSLPFSPISLKMSPRGTLDRTSNELRWQVPHIEVCVFSLSPWIFFLLCLDWKPCTTCQKCIICSNLICCFLSYLQFLA
jgi:hypothetical protein